MIKFSPELQGMLDEIKRECPDLRTDTAAVRYAVRFTCDKLVPDYVKLQRERLTRNTPENKAQQSMDIQQAKEEIKKDKGRNICESLGGTINDKDMCTYTTYMFISKTNIQKGSITVPVEELSELDIRNQYKLFDGTEISKEDYEARLAA